jgi:transposase InsO family protein
MSCLEERPILTARLQTNLGPGRLAGICRRPRSTIYKVLRRNGISRRASAPRPAYRRYEWSRPGALLHVDMAELPRFGSPGHAVTGDRSYAGRKMGLGKVYLHCVVDDRTRYAYVEQHQAKDGATAAAVLERAIAHLGALGIEAPEAVMSDNAFAYRKSRAFKDVLARHRARHILTPPYTPRWNGKVERFIQTLKRERAYAHSWPSSAERSKALGSFLRYYNRRRPHSSLSDRPPISRVHNVRGQDS